jgi:hypothetical protein
LCSKIQREGVESLACKIKLREEEGVDSLACKIKQKTKIVIS